MLKGRCECGAIRFESDAPITEFSHCHCSQCRRLHGAAFATYAEVAADRFRYTAGSEAVRDYNSSEYNRRSFCGTCGSNLTVRSSRWPAYVYVAMGVVHDYDTLPEAYHQYYDSRAPWHEVHDGLPAYGETAPD